MRVLITGGAGMVGSHTAEYYAQKRNDVVILDNLMRSQLFAYDKASVEYNWNYLADFKNIKRIRGDVRNEKDVLCALGDGVDVIVHTAGQPGVGFSIDNPSEDYSINAQGTFTVLECVRKVCPKATFVYCSTNKVYGENVSTVALKEQTKRYEFDRISGIAETMSIDRCGHTPYGISKLMGDLYAQEYAYSYGLKVGVFRMSCIYGTRQFGFEDQGWIAWFIIAALFGKPITIYGDGKQVRDVLYVGDLIQAYDKFINSDIKSAVFNVGGGAANTLSLLEFVDILEEMLGKKIPLRFADWRLSDQKVYISDLSKITSELSWCPQVGVREGIEKVKNWVSAHKDFFVCEGTPVTAVGSTQK
ncbi:MAG: NAD-dependent epimerase/dehydratase family protein [Candidatus Omnitrophica bacterium]|nr:NAD-dependent epimerase/dehydratase family protein [Candidatus Omnitrophota bacterium]